MEEVERARERLDNVRSVKPILNGLRTISLGSWQAALKRRSDVRAYAEQLQAMLPSLLPHLKTEEGLLHRLRARFSLNTPRLGERAVGTKGDSAPRRVEALVIGSERGLCGRFNVAVAEKAERYIRRVSGEGFDVRLRTLGGRAQRVLKRHGFEATSASTLSFTTLPPLSLAVQMADGWLTAYEQHELDIVDLIYNDYLGTGAYEPTVTRLVPPRLPPREGVSLEGDRVEPTTAWPPPIVDTDPLSLYATVIQQWTAVQFYSVLLNSSAAEHSTRFQLMESATQNADQLIEELTLVIQTARRQEITEEMAELAAGAGLLQKE